MKQGWIKLHRKILDWQWYGDLNTRALFIHLLLKANHEEKKWMGITVGRGQIITGRIKLAEEVGLTQRQVRTSLSKLKSTNEVTSKSTNKYTVITINNYDEYQQNDQQDGQRVTSKRPANDHKQELKNVKNVKNEKKEDEELMVVLKKNNRLNLTRSQIFALHSEFPSLTLEEIKEQVTKCNNYMTISSANYTNPGLFFKGWIKKYSIEKSKKEADAKRNQEILEELPKISEEERKINREKIAQIKNLYKIKGV
jgi:hypothetical protein